MPKKRINYSIRLSTVQNDYMTPKIKFSVDSTALPQRAHFMLSEPTKSIKNLLASRSENGSGFKDFQDNRENLSEMNFWAILRSDGNLP